MRGYFGHSLGDTSDRRSPSGVLSDPQAVADAVKRVSPETLVVLDAVCAVASEEIRMDDWGIDVVITASQKGLGAPPGLSIVIASQKAMKVKSVCGRPGTTSH